MDPFYWWGWGHGWAWMLVPALLVLCAMLTPGRLAHGRRHVESAIERLHRGYGTGEISSQQYQDMKRSTNEILNRRYATGEISAGQYRELKPTLNV